MDCLRKRIRGIRHDFVVVYNARSSFRKKEYSVITCPRSKYFLTTKIFQKMFTYVLNGCRKMTDRNPASMAAWVRVNFTILIARDVINNS
jgi:hypothetical protein